MTTDPGQRWRLQVWDRDKKLIFDGTCDGDAHLDATLRPLEARPDFGRFSTTRETRTGDRPTVSSMYVEPPPPVDHPCRECGLPRAECRRRAAVSGHDYTPEES